MNRPEINDAEYLSHLVRHGNLREIIESAHHLIESFVLSDREGIFEMLRLYNRMTDMLVAGQIGRPTVEAYCEEMIDKVR